MANFIKSGTKAGITGALAEAAHRIVALLHATMILFNPVVQVLTVLLTGSADKSK